MPTDQPNPTKQLTETEQERQQLIHQWKVLTKNGDTGEAALIYKKLKDTAPIQLPTSGSVETKIVEQDGQLVTVVKKGRGRPKGSKNRR